MASAKGLNPSAPEFRSRTRLVFSDYPLLPPPLRYASCFYSFSNVLTAAAYFPSSPATYSIPVPPDLPYSTHHLKDHVVPATKPATHQTEQLAEVEQQTHEAVQNFVPPKVPRNRGCKKGFRRNSRYFDQPTGRSSRTWKPAEGKSPKKYVENNWRVPRRIWKRFSDVLPVKKNGDGTTVMIKNIPNKYSRDLLIAFLDRHCAKENQKSDGEKSESESESAFDFLYLPIDFWTGMNKGYAFVNFTNSKAVWKFYLAAHCKTWDSFHSNKIREIAYARIQGKKDLIQHFETMGFPCESENVLPVCFSPPWNGSEKVVKRRNVGKLEGWDLTGLKRQAAGTCRKFELVKEGSSAS
ncbi:hypothetical protein ACLB2K_013119 [Fragaria x ananassa]